MKVAFFTIANTDLQTTREHFGDASEFGETEHLKEKRNMLR